MSLGKKLSLHRKALGLSQEDVARKIRVTQKTLATWENNETEPDLQNLKQLAKLFETSIDDLLDTGLGNDDDALGICKSCGISINENNLGSKVPVVLCRRCVEVRKAQERRAKMEQDALKQRQEKAQLARARAEYDAIKERRGTILRKLFTSFAVAAIPTIAWGVLMYFTLQNNYNEKWLAIGSVLAFCIFSFVALLFYDGPVRDLLVYMCTASIKWPGLVYTWDLDGFLWVIAMKTLFWLLGVIFGLICGFFGIILGLIVSPFVFLYKIGRMIYDYFHADISNYV